MIKLINLTPHTLNVRTNGGADVVLPASGQVARVAVTNRHHTVGCPQGAPCNPQVVGDDVGGHEVWEWDDFISLQVQEVGEVTGLPEPQRGVLLIVSAQVRQAVPHRRDVASPGDLVRDDKGQPTGCKGLVVNRP